jgi:hypothetical protein
MRTNPLQEILDAAMKLDEPLMDTEWPAADETLLREAARSRIRPNTAPTLRPLVAALRR